MTKVKTKPTSKASQKRKQDSLAVKALENATVAALQVCNVELVSNVELHVVVCCHMTLSIYDLRSRFVC